MVIINIPRMGYQEEEMLVKVLHRIWNMDGKIKMKFGGCMDVHPESVHEAFQMAWRAFGRIPFVKFHCLDVFLEEDVTEREALCLTDVICNLLMENFQFVCALCRQEGAHRLVFLINSVSYRSGRSFHGNNRAYMEIKEMIDRAFGSRHEVVLGDSVLYQNGEDYLRYEEMRK